MPIEIKDGQQLDIGSVKSGGDFTYKGKSLKFEQPDKENNPNLYKAKVEFSDEEKKLGNKDQVITVLGPRTVEGTISVTDALLDDENLTDAEKFTLMNSLAYQTGTPENTQIADGRLRTHIGVQAVANKKSEQEQQGLQKAKKDQVEKQAESKAAADKAASEKPATTASTEQKLVDKK
jgi:hypothetical protein